MSRPTTLGLIVGNRGFFPAHLCESGRPRVIKVLESLGFRVLATIPEAFAHPSAGLVGLHVMHRFL